MSDLVERLREEALEAHKEAWRRRDGGQEYSMGAMLAEEAADRIEALEAALEAMLLSYWMPQSVGKVRAPRPPREFVTDEVE